MEQISIFNYNFKKWSEINDFSISLPPYWDDYIHIPDATKIENFLLENKYLSILPYPDLVFYSFKCVFPEDLKIVIIGQDPYIKKINNIPQAMGLSFSVPYGMSSLPPSLINIYDNLQKYNHLMFYPRNGNLEFWANQGCLLLNASLTVEENKSNSHSHIWRNFTDNIIKQLSSNFDKLIFVLWGDFAYNKINLIDIDKHEVVISSHPSPMSFNKPLKNYEAFINTDCFGKINEYLGKMNKRKMIWQIN